MNYQAPSTKNGARSANADFVGPAIETVSWKISCLKSDPVIHLATGDKMRLVQSDRLSQMSEGF